MPDAEKRGELANTSAPPIGTTGGGGGGGTWSSAPTVACEETSPSPLRRVSGDSTDVPSTGDGKDQAGRKEKVHSVLSTTFRKRAAGGEEELIDQSGRGGESKADPVRRKVEELESNGYILVGFEEGDLENPRNWNRTYRFFLVSFCSYLNVCVASQASAYSTGSSKIREEFDASAELVTAGLSLYILGFALGPPLVAPLSEQFGRRPVYLICWALWVLMSFPIAFSPSIEGIIICRFIAGLMASPPLANTGGVVSDLFARDSSGPAMAIYTLGSCIGPAIGNVYATFIAEKLGWRWIYYLTALLIFGLHWPIIYFILPETRHNIILERKAARLRRETNSDKFVSVHATEKKSLSDGLKISLSRPFRFLVTEPITMFASAWNGFLYGLIFLFNDAFAEVWGPGNGGYSWQSASLVQLTFLSLIVGCVLAAISYPYLGERFYQKRILEAGESVPEARMFVGCFGCILLPVGLFLTAWTCFPDRIVWIVPLLGPAIFGYGFFFVLFGILTYLTDSYGAYSASALGAAILIRNIIGAIFPLFGSYMYRNLGNHWATSLIAFLSLPLIPITWFFYLQGRRLREASPFASAHFNEDEDAPH